MSEAAGAIIKKTREPGLEEPGDVSRRIAGQVAHGREGIRIAEERLVQAERGEVEMIPWG